MVKSSDMITGLIRESEFLKSEMLRRVSVKTDDTVLIGDYIVDLDFSSGMVTMMNRKSGDGFFEYEIDDFALKIKQ